MEKPIVKTGEEAAAGSPSAQAAARRFGEAVLFAGVITISCFAVIAVALAAPFVLAGAVIAGLFSKGGAPRAWRSAGA